MQILNKLKQLDAYPKVNEDFYSRTLSGGLITVISSVFMALLFITELRLFFYPQTTNQLVVDTARGETLTINLDITFPSLACSAVSLDALDISGEQHHDIRHNIFKKRLDPSGKEIAAPKADTINRPKIGKPLQRHGGSLEENEKYCGSCYGAEMSDDQCCNSCEDVREAYRQKGWAIGDPEIIDQCKREGHLQKIKEEDGEGCNVYGHLEVNKVAGNFHFVSVNSFQQVNMLLLGFLEFQMESFNVSHKINELSFGAHFPGVVNPLDGVVNIQKSAHGMYQYFIKVVPTLYTDIRGHKIATNQFSVTEHFIKGGSGSRYVPGLFFIYDLSPIKVKFVEERVSFLHFLTNVCAIVGGIFTVSGIIDSFIYHGHRAIKKKVELGKLS
ncbi:unnamed protein product [Sphagnum balticum]